MTKFTTTLLLSLLVIAPVLRAADQPAPADKPPVVEFRLLGKGKPVSLPLDKTSQFRKGKRITPPGAAEGVFTGTVVTLKPSLTASGDITYEGTLEEIEYLGLEPAENGSLTVQTRSETVELKGELSNHAAVAVSLPELGRTVYFALDDPARPKKDCAACGPRDKGVLAKPDGN